MYNIGTKKNSTDTIMRNKDIAETKTKKALRRKKILFKLQRPKSSTFLS